MGFPREQIKSLRRAAVFSGRTQRSQLYFALTCTAVKLLSPPFRYLPTLAAWLLLGLVLLVLVPLAYPVKLPLQYHLYHLVLFLALIIVYYGNINFLLPRVFPVHGLAVYLLLLTVFAAAVIFLMQSVESLLKIRQLMHVTLNPTEPYVEKTNIFIFLYLVILFTGAVVAGVVAEMVRRATREEKRSMILREEKSQAELRTLKAQIQPHFFFNTLNTIHALSHTDVPQAREALLKLSKMMRFAMNEENRDRVSLKEEIAFVTDYLDLMRHRLPKNVTLLTEIVVPPTDLEIAPMILLTFIENCFKHGVTFGSPCEISIKIALKKNLLTLQTWNYFDPDKKGEGIGLRNTVKRLHILYGDRYHYEAGGTDRMYTCLLTLDL